MLQKMPGMNGKICQPARLLLVLRGHPSKKNYCSWGVEFAQANEWNSSDAELPGLLNNPLHAGVQKIRGSESIPLRSSGAALA
jgi:hypothetical protein